MKIASTSSRPFAAIARIGAALALAAPMACAQTGLPVQAAAATTTATDGESTRVASSLGPLRVTTLARGLDHPWSLAFLTDGRWLIAERGGRLRAFDPATRTLSAPIGGLPAVWTQGQGGLLDVVADPKFAVTGLIYFTYAEQGANGRAGTAVARARLDGLVLRDLQVLFRQQPKLSSGAHFGSRIVFDRDGYLFVTLGENNERPTAQALDQHQGKVIRLHPDGRIPDDNPFRGVAGAMPEIWSYGHRNPQGAARHPRTGQLWTVEHGPQGGDEINIPRAGKNYGWPIITHGIDYDGKPIPEAIGTSAPGMEQPVRHWEPSIAPSGMAFYRGMALQGWNDDVFVGGLVARQLVRIDLEGDVAVGEERLLGELGWRIRDVRMGLDDALYLLTDEADGRLLKVEPAKAPPGRRLHGRPPPKSPAGDRVSPRAAED